MLRIANYTSCISLAFVENTLYLSEFVDDTYITIIIAKKGVFPVQVGAFLNGGDVQFPCYLTGAYCRIKHHGN